MKKKRRIKDLLQSVPFMLPSFAGMIVDVYKRQDVAAAAGVSAATVSYVLNGKKKVSEQTKNEMCIRDRDRNILWKALRSPE